MCVCAHSCTIACGLQRFKFKELFYKSRLWQKLASQMEKEPVLKCGLHFILFNFFDGNQNKCVLMGGMYEVLVCSSYLTILL